MRRPGAAAVGLAALSIDAVLGHLALADLLRAAGACGAWRRAAGTEARAGAAAASLGRGEELAAGAAGASAALAPLPRLARHIGIGRALAGNRPASCASGAVPWRPQWMAHGAHLWWLASGLFVLEREAASGDRALVRWVGAAGGALRRPPAATLRLPPGVHQVAPSPCGSLWAASREQRGAAWLYDVRDPAAAPGRLGNAEDSIVDVGWAPTGDHCALLHAGGALSVWDVRDGACPVWRLTQQVGVRPCSVHWSGCGEWLSWRAPLQTPYWPGGEVSAWQVGRALGATAAASPAAAAALPPPVRLEAEAKLYGWAWAPRGAACATLERREGADGRGDSFALALWPPQGGEAHAVRTGLRGYRLPGATLVADQGAGHSGAALTWSPDGIRLLLRGRQLLLFAMDGAEPTLLRRYRAARAVLWAPCGRLFAAATGAGVRVLGVPGVSTRGVLLRGRVGLVALAWSPCGTRLCAVREGSVVVWDFAPGGLPGAG